LLEGAARRGFILQSSRKHLVRTTDPSDENHRDVFAVTEINLHLNSFYLHLRGILDNLAWALHHALVLIPEVGSEEGKGRTRVNLFSKDFVAALTIKDAACARAIQGYDAWSRELADLRDPAAHRIPLYAIPGHMNSDRQSQKYAPLFTTSGPSGYTMKTIPTCVWRDAKAHIALGQAVTQTLEAI
jgi:hypothetical protein